MKNFDFNFFGTNDNIIYQILKHLDYLHLTQAVSINRTWHEHVFRSFPQTLEKLLLKSVDIKENNSSIIKKIIELPAVLAQSIQQLRIATDLDPDNASAYLNLGCYCHAQAININDQVLYQNSEAAFQISISLNPVEINTRVEYAIFLLHQKRYKEILNYLSLKDVLIIDTKDKNAIKDELKQTHIHYNAAERCRLPPALQVAIDQFVDIELNEKVLATYLLILTTLELEQFDECRLFLKQFIYLIEYNETEIYLTLAAALEVPVLQLKNKYLQNTNENNNNREDANASHIRLSNAPYVLVTQLGAQQPTEDSLPELEEIAENEDSSEYTGMGLD